MTDQDALYRAIIASPEEDTPRLVYADWLEENGRAEEAEFIRLDCRLGDSGIELPDHVEMTTRREELRLWLEAHVPGPRLRLKSGWHLPGAHLPGGWWENSVRGFPRFLNLSMHEREGVRGVRRIAAALADAFKRLPTRWIIIHSVQIEDLAELLKQPVISALEGLTVNSVSANPDEAAQLIAECPFLGNLRELALLLSVGDAGAAALGQSAHLHRLRRFMLQATNLTPAAVRSLGRSQWFRDLSDLSLEDQFGDEAFEALCHHAAMPVLQSLALASCHLSPRSWENFAGSKTFPNLKRLGLNATVMNEGCIEAFTGGYATPLIALYLKFCGIGDVGMRVLLESPLAASLRTLNLAYNGLGPASARSLASCKKLERLQQLDISGNHLGPALVHAANRLPRGLVSINVGIRTEETETRNLRPSHVNTFLQTLTQPGLRHLDLSGLPIDVSGIQTLSGDKFRTLRRLGLSNCRITDEAVSVLLASPALQNLIELTLDQNRITTGVKSLVSKRVLPQLSHCPLHGNPLDPDMPRKLARRRGVKVYPP